MWFDGQRQPNTLYVASVSRGKDSTAMLRAIQLLNFPLDAVVSADVWATDDIPAELPPMVDFKNKWDAKCLEVFGVPVTRVCAEKDGNKLTYNDVFYRKVSVKGARENFRIYGFPYRQGAWCNSRLKAKALKQIWGSNEKRQLYNFAQNWQHTDSSITVADGVLENSKGRLSRQNGFQICP